MAYSARAQLDILSSQRNDRLGFQTEWGVRLESNAVWRGVQCRLSTDDAGRVIVTLDTLEAPTEGVAYLLACEALADLVPLISLAIQSEHVNRHYGPIRVCWSRAAVQVSPPDEWPSAAVGMRSSQRVATPHLSTQLSALEGTPEFRQLLRSYDRSLEPDDDETRFFNAFAIVEFVEGRFGTREQFAPLLAGGAVDAIVDAARQAAMNAHLDRDVAARIANLVAAPLQRATVEGRNTKLLAILRDRFAIPYVEDAIGRVAVDADLVARLIEARNRLFHGAAADPAGFARLTDTLTMLVELILVAFLSRQVALP